MLFCENVRTEENTLFRTQLNSSPNVQECDLKVNVKICGSVLTLRLYVTHIYETLNIISETI
ncbi:hypothetical protein BBBOND_0100230 [Babesia bigemina]|uniref:Uncharacterized protein n=1 Tax=Babesia bigemina TaxID=5866 RepID=A0A061D3Z0_BABBI|nr:hypothetical protein BBBOND_0100230 [Babesia bigemina]CDR93694.1 hypothetical protein BBBOND_0100230 [Babesia bigemina]|eukprot:XP_012765880.1 hypothetical protein BBBOND_0100230 [Babesia bigemina]